MSSKQIENLVLLLIVCLFILAIYVILYHPEWLIWIFTYQG